MRESAVIRRARMTALVESRANSGVTGERAGTANPKFQKN
jgi:hypothetical protein